MGELRIRQRDRVKTGAPHGLDVGWTEHQVWRGRQIVGRYDTHAQAVEAMKSLRDYDEKARQERAKALSELAEIDAKFI
jgi:hypothetical protein